MNVLFIGGSRDGATMRVRENPIIEIPIRGRIETYRMQRFNVEGTIILIYVHQSISLLEAINRLIDHYKP